MNKIMVLCMLFSTNSFAEDIVTSKNSVYVKGEITIDSAYKTAQEVHSLSKKVPKVYLIIDSPGGTLEGAFLIKNELCELRKKIDTVTIMSGGAAFYLSQMFNRRLITKTGVIAIMKPTASFTGVLPDFIENYYMSIVRKVREMNQFVIKRTRGMYTEDSYNKLIENEFWCAGEKCKSAGFIDGIVTI